MEVEGTFESLYDFCVKISELPRIVNVQNITTNLATNAISSKPIVKAQFITLTFRFVSPEETAAAEAEAVKKKNNYDAQNRRNNSFVAVRARWLRRQGRASDGAAQGGAASCRSKAGSPYSGASGGFDCRKERRNPFASYLAKQIEKPARERTPLECCDLMTFKVSAVVVSPTGNYALLQASDGKRYIVKKGDRIGLKDGSIVHIGKDVLVVEENRKGSGR